MKKFIAVLAVAMFVFVRNAKADTITITSISPTTGATVGGDAVDITGTGFMYHTDEAVYFGGKECPNWGGGQDEIQVTTPPGSVGPVNVTITADDGSATVVNGFTYVFVPPAITDISPDTGMILGGDNIGITGVGFAVGATVTIDGVEATNVIQYGGHYVALTTPPGLAGPADVVVTNPDGSIATLSDGFTYNAVPEPSTTVLLFVGFATFLAGRFFFRRKK